MQMTQLKLSPQHEFGPIQIFLELLKLCPQQENGLFYSCSGRIWMITSFSSSSSSFDNDIPVTKWLRRRRLLKKRARKKHLIRKMDASLIYIFFIFSSSMRIEFRPQECCAAHFFLPIHRRNYYLILLLYYCPLLMTSNHDLIAPRYLPSNPHFRNLWSRSSTNANLVKTENLATFSLILMVHFFRSL